ncbi:MAG TPA: hypothetical protein DD727_07620 [Clostridiales bacterium]|nr:hypothetical protein [Clostridiales bacterium]
MTVSARDKKLISYVIFFGFLLLAYTYGYTPLMAKLDETETRYKSVETQYKNAQIQMNSIDSLKGQTEALKETALARANKFFPEKQEDMLDLIHGVINNSGIGFQGAAMAENSMKPILTVTNPATQAKFPLGDAAEAINKTLKSQAGLTLNTGTAAKPAVQESCESFRVSLSMNNTGLDRVVGFLQGMEALDRGYLIRKLSYNSQPTGTGSLELELYIAPTITGE